tara:strand:+ start:1217 stop:1819 length:603 start_codon:yes stop_codon:yes gene_type:complete
MSKLKGKEYTFYDKDKIKYTNFNCKNPNCKKKQYYIDETLAINNDRLNYINVNYNGKYVVIKTPPMTMPFKINDKTGSFIMNLQFTNYKDDKSMNEFYEFIRNVEQTHIKHIGINESTVDRYSSQIRRDKNKKYDPNLVVKIPFRYNKFECEAYNKEGNLINLLNINPFSKVQCDIYIDKIWLFNDIFICKWKCQTIQLI